MFCCIALMVVVIGYVFSCIGKLWNIAVERAKATGDKSGAITILLIALYTVGIITACCVLAAVS